MIRTLAERVGDPPKEGLDVQQSDYVMAWSGSGRPATRKGPKVWLRKVFRLLPMTTQSRLEDILTRNTLSNPQAMRRWRGSIAE